MATAVYASPPASMKEVEGSGELNYSAEGLTGTRKAVVLGTDLNHAIGFLLGATQKTTTNETVVLPQPWPGIPSLFVESIRAYPEGKSGLSTWTNAVLPSTRYRLDIAYRSLSLQGLSGDDKEKPENVDYLIQEVDYSCETVIVPVKVTDTNASAVSTTREVKHYIRLPKVEYSVTIPKVRYPKFDVIQDLNGKINSKVVFGGAIGTVLFDGPKLSNTISSISDPAWKFMCKFIYNKFGWNNVLHPETLKWVAAGSIDGGTTKPYDYGDLTRLWTRNP